MRIYKVVLIFVFILAVFLRFYSISNDPPGLYIDEVSIGNNAYSILKTGKDEYGQNTPTFFRSFGDYKMPVYVYSVAGAMSIFGKNEFAIRFPSALAGTLTVIVLYLFVKKLLELDGENAFRSRFKYLPILSALLLATSPWHIQFSRGGFEVNVAVFLFLTACMFMTIFIKNRNIFYLFSGYLLFILSIYTYHTFRILSPIALIILSIFFLYKFSKERIKLMIIFGICFIFLLPIFKFSLTQNGMERFTQTSAFIEYPVNNLFEKINIYPVVFLKNYLSFYSLDYLFNFGDGIGRHQIPEMGLLYIWQFPFILVGLYVLIKEKKSYFKYVIVILLLLSPLPASIARPSPHTLRNLLSVIPFIIIVSMGILFFLGKIQKWIKISILIIFGIGVYSFLSYLHFYSFHYTKVNILDWDGGSRLAAEALLKYDRNNFKIIVDEKIRNIIYYYSFYGDGVSSNLELVHSDWVKPVEWKNLTVLYIRPYYGAKNGPNIIENIILPNQNHDIVFQIWKY